MKLTFAKAAAAALIPLLLVTAACGDNNPYQKVDNASASTNIDGTTATLIAKGEFAWKMPDNGLYLVNLSKEKIGTLNDLKCLMLVDGHGDLTYSGISCDWGSANTPAPVPHPAP